MQNTDTTSFYSLWKNSVYNLKFNPEFLQQRAALEMK